MSQVPYGPTSHEDPRAIAVIDGVAGRRWFNALTLTFAEAGDRKDTTPIGTGQQGRGARLITRVGILFGLRNYRAMNTTLTFADSSTLLLATRDAAPTAVTRGDGSAVATLTRGETTTATSPTGEKILDFVPDPLAPVTESRYRMHCLAADGSVVAVIDLIRTASGWTDAQIVGDVLDLLAGYSSSGGNSLPTLFLGTRLMLIREPSPLEREVLLAACVELGVLARAYWTAMGQETAWG